MMALRRPALEGAGALAATRRPARRTAVRAGWAVRGRRGCAEVVWGARGGAAAARHRPLGSGSCEAVAAGLATTWGRWCLSTPPEPLPFRPSCPFRTARRILCVVCCRQWSKLGLEGTDGAIWLVLSTSALHPANSSNDTGSHTREQANSFTAQRPGRGRRWWRARAAAAEVARERSRST